MTGSATPQIPATSRILVTYYLTQGNNGILAAILKIEEQQQFNIFLLFFLQFPEKMFLLIFLILNCNWWIE